MDRTYKNYFVNLYENYYRFEFPQYGYNEAPKGMLLRGDKKLQQLESYKHTLYIQFESKLNNINTYINKYIHTYNTYIPYTFISYLHRKVQGQQQFH